MVWHSEWRALENRIAGIESAYELFLKLVQIRSEDPYAVGRKVFRPAIHGIAVTLTGFVDRHGGQLPPTARETATRFIAEFGGLLSDTQLDNLPHTGACVTALAALRTEMAFGLADHDALWQSVAERSLQHLQRSIVADPQVGRTWKEAFETGEVSCERLGAAHLLLHGLWAFKVSATGERTDLVFSDVAIDEGEVRKGGGALVLTEWKLVRNEGEATAAYDGAVRQARRYARGALGGVELSASRFIVIVSRGLIVLPEDTEHDGVTYRARGVAVNPAVPSKA